jgi:hypothetical protein
VARREIELEEERPTSRMTGIAGARTCQSNALASSGILLSMAAVIITGEMIYKNIPNIDIYI